MMLRLKGLAFRFLTVLMTPHPVTGILLSQMEEAVKHKLLSPVMLPVNPFVHVTSEPEGSGTIL